MSAMTDKLFSSKSTRPSLASKDPTGTGEELCTAVYVLGAAVTWFAYTLVVVIVDHMFVLTTNPQSNVCMLHSF